MIYDLAFEGYVELNFEFRVIYFGEKEELFLLYLFYNWH
jgi:hypothetical protein